MKKNKIGKAFRRTLAIITVLGVITATLIPSIGFAKEADEFGEDYYNGTYDIEEYELDHSLNTLEKRLQVASRHGWEEYLDDENYLTEDFFGKYSDKELTYLCQKDHEISYLYNPGPLSPGKNKNAAGISRFAARAASGKVTGVTKGTTLGYTTSVFSISDPTTGYSGNAFCAQHSKYTPPVGTALTNGGLVTNENIRKCVYYWHTGDIQAHGSTYTFGYTSLAISYFNGDTFENNQTFRDFMQWIKNKPNAPSDFKVYWARTADTSYQDLVYGKMDDQKGYLRVQKVSANTAVTNGNENYSVQGAKYTIYSDAACTKAVETLTINANGYSNTSGALKAGTYYIKETGAAVKGYQIDTKTVYTASVTANHTSKSPLTIKATEQPKLTSISIEKASSLPDLTNGNPNYSLTGAVYRIYTDKDCTKWTNKSITTDANGKGTITGLPLDEYYLKEYSAPNSYRLDKTVYYVDGRDQFGVNTVEVKMNVKELPSLPEKFNSTIAIQKVDAETGKATPVGNGSLENAQFEVKFYKVSTTTYATKDPATDGKKAARTWILKTDSEGKVYFDNKYKLSGDDFYLDNEGNPTIPRGVLTYREIKSPDGYLINPEIIVVPVKPGSNDSEKVVYVTPKQPEQALTLNLVKTQTGTATPIPGAVFEHTLPDGSKETKTTDENGKIAFQGLQHGNHTIKETSVPDGYAVNANQITFTVADDNTITITSSATETDLNGNITLTVESDGTVSAAVEDKLAPFDLHIHKINNKNTVLKGAEFTLYSDEGCKNAITSGATDSKGDLTFEDLIPGKTYYMKETKAPQGYRIPVNSDGSDIVYKVKVDSCPVNDKFEFYVNDKAYTTSSKGQFTVSGTKAERVVNMIITNEITNQLPVTGSTTTLIMFMIGVLLTLAGITGVKIKSYRTII